MSSHLKTNQMFDSVVKNGLDFFKQSIEGLERSPKHSLINFCAAVELFLKARLMLEHWSLIIEKPDQANMTKFLAGDFKSVSMKEAIERLQNIAEIKLRKQSETFYKLRNHRNNLVHFYHGQYPDDPKGFRESVILEQHKAWFYLYQLLTDQWREEFAKYANDIREIYDAMKIHRDFLEAKHNEIRPKIDGLRSEGHRIFVCDICGYDSNMVVGEIENGLRTSCLVCDIESDKLKVPCPECGNDIFVEDMGEGTCENCERQVDISYLLAFFADYSRAYCSECGYVKEETVIPFENHFLCLFCLTRWHEYDVGVCEWCTEMVTGPKGSFWSPGCLMCADHIRMDSEDD